MAPAGAEARLRTKQHLLDVLCDRIRDQTSYVRKDVLQVCASREFQLQQPAPALSLPLGACCTWEGLLSQAEAAASSSGREPLTLSL